MSRAWLETVEAVPRVSRTTDGERILCFTPPIAKWFSSDVQRVRCPLRVFFPFVRRTAVRISLHGIARQEASRLATWCDRSSMWRSLDLRVVATNTLCASSMMTRSVPHFVRTTFNHSVACVCFRSATCFAKQNVFLHVWEVHVGRQSTRRV